MLRMRTDSTSLSETALAAARSQITEMYGADYLPDKPRQYAKKVKGAQEAHEAIRPAGDSFKTPDVVAAQVNDDEARMLTGESNLILAGRRLMGLGPKTIVIKKGEHGSVLFHSDGLFMLPAYPVTRVEDPTGAGDSYLGALVGSLAAQGATGFAALKRSLIQATATASPVNIRGVALTAVSTKLKRVLRALRNSLE